VTIDERFAKKTQREGACLRWTGAIGPNGYGRFNAGSARIVYAHRFAYERAQGPIPQLKDLDHLCRNRWCVEPRHLQAVERRENLRRSPHYSVANAGVCRRGHSIAEHGRRNREGYFFCLECQRVRRAVARAQTSGSRAVLSG
jgi:hypothetical protein